MADVSISKTALVENTRSGDLVAGGTDINTGQTFEIAAANQTDDLVLILEEQDGSTATVTFDAGDEPPSMRAGLGSLTISLAANDLRALILEGGRFIQSDGKITGSITGGVRITALDLPRTS